MSKSAKSSEKPLTSSEKSLTPSGKPLNPEEIKAIVEKKLAGKIDETQVINRELAIWVTPANLLTVCKFLKESELKINHPRCLCGVDRKEYLEVVYHLCSIERHHKITVKVKLPLAEPVLPSLYPIYKGADWHERETAEMFGIVFEGHPDPRHLLLVEDFEGYPLRKDFPLPNR